MKNLRPVTLYLPLQPSKEEHILNLTAVLIAEVGAIVLGNRDDQPGTPRSIRRKPLSQLFIRTVEKSH